MSFGPWEYLLVVLKWIWRPSNYPNTGYIAYIVVGTTFLSSLAGLPFGFALCGVRRLFKWLNDEKWLNQP